MLTALLCLAVSAAPPPSLAVTYFDVEAPEPELQPAKKALAALVLTNLAALSDVAVVPRERFNALFEELRPQSPYAEPAEARKLGKALLATHILTGRLQLVKDELRLSARVIDVQTGRVVASREAVSPTGKFFALEKELVALAVSALGLHPTPKQKLALAKNQTESFDAFLRYGFGLERLDRRDGEGARAAFEEALRADHDVRASRSSADEFRAAEDALRLGPEGDGVRVKPKSLADGLAALDPNDPDLYHHVERLLPEGPDRAAAELQVVDLLTKSRLRPRRAAFPNLVTIGASRWEYVEAQRLLAIVTAHGAEPQFLALTPMVIEHLARKFDDDPNLLMQLREALPRFEQLVAKADFSKPSPALEGGLGPVLALYGSAAAVEPLEPAARRPAATLARLRTRLDAELGRRVAEFDAEFDRRLKALDPSAAALELTREVAALQLLALAYPKEYQRPTRLEGARRQVQVCRWLVEHAQVRPRRGAEFLELSALLGWLQRFARDPASSELIAGLGRYLVKRFPEATYLPLQLKSAEQAVAEVKKDAEAQRRWLQGFPLCDVCEAGDEVRALFKDAASLAAR